MTVSPVAAPAFLQLQRLSDEEESLRTRLIGQLHVARKANGRQEAFYEGSRKVRDLGIAIPPHLRDVEAVAAWPEIVVDVLDEKMDWRGWDCESPTVQAALAQVYRDNHLGIEVGQATLDALICGLAYMSVGTGDDGEPDLLVKAESPNLMTATWDPRTRRAREALREVYNDRARLTGWKLYVPGETVTVERVGGKLMVTDRDEHGRERIPVAVMLNRPRSSRTSGRSEITRAVRSLTESGMRTLLGMEVTREFYGAPQRYLMGADESMFVDEDGNRKTQWDAIIGRMLMAPRNEDGDLPTPGQFSAASPQPFTEILKTLAQMVSSATGIPATHLGFATDNPTSADAIAKADRRMDKRAVRRQRQYDLGLVELGELCMLWAEDGAAPENGVVQSLWDDPGALTPSAAADRATKMIAAEVLQPEWDFTLEQFGLSDAEIQRVQRERRRSGGSAALRAIAQAAQEGRPVVVPSGDAG